ncbi:hypothetical protein IWW43_003344, partial [Coemansia sp. RSA 1935]
MARVFVIINLVVGLLLALCLRHETAPQAEPEQLLASVDANAYAPGVAKPVRAAFVVL